MLVSQVMQKNVPTVLATESLQVAGKKMKEHKAGVVVVLEGDSIQGVLTEKGLSRAMKTIPRNVGSMRVKQRAESGRSSYDDGHRCNYFSEVQVELLLDR